jgi:hypothetical protein
MMFFQIDPSEHAKYSWYGSEDNVKSDEKNNKFKCLISLDFSNPKQAKTTSSNSFFDSRNHLAI